MTIEPMDQIPAPRPDPSMAASERAIYPCGCGLWRSLPGGIRVGDVVQQVPCPRCGAAPRLRYWGANVEPVEPGVPVTLEERRG